MITLKHIRCLAAIAVLILNVSLTEVDSSITGTLKKWDAVTIDFQGPQADAMDSNPNPFLDYRLQVHFTSPGGRTYNVPATLMGTTREAGQGTSGVSAFLLMKSVNGASGHPSKRARKWL